MTNIHASHIVKIEQDARPLTETPEHQAAVVSLA
jgi:hypothetical protein